MRRWIRWISCRQCLCECRCAVYTVYVRCIFLFRLELVCLIWSAFLHSSFIIQEVQGVCSTQTTHKRKQINTHLTPAEKLTTGKKSPSVLKFSNMPWTGCPLILKEMLGAPRSRQQLTTSSEVRMCWFMDATARGIRPVRHTHTHSYVKYDPVSDAGTDHVYLSHTHRIEHTYLYTRMHTVTHTLGKEIVPAGYWFCLDTTWL